MDDQGHAGRQDRAVWMCYGDVSRLSPDLARSITNRQITAVQVIKNVETYNCVFYVLLALACHSFY